MDWKKLVGLRGPSLDAGEWKTRLGPDFPESAGDREKGKFRESAYPRLTTIAVADDEGNPIGTSNLQVEEEVLLELKAIRLGIQMLLWEMVPSMSGTDLREMTFDH